MTVTGLSAGTSNITVQFTPSDTNNYNVPSQKSYRVIVEVKKATAPTSSMCKTLTYTGKNLTLTESPGEGYTFVDNTVINAGTHTVYAKLNNGYQWSDGGTDNKSILCVVGKATPTVTLSSTGGTIGLTGTASYTVSAVLGTMSVAGTVQNVSSNTNVATVTPASVNNSSQVMTVTGVNAGVSTIGVQFTPSDTNNYNAPSQKSYKVVVEGNVVAIPSDVNCANPSYTGSTLTLTKDIGNDYTLSSNTGIDVGDYSITAKLKGGNIWSDGSVEDKSFTCKINKGIPTIKIHSISNVIKVSTSSSYTVSAFIGDDVPVKGVFDVVDLDTNIVKITSNGSGESTSQVINVFGVSAGTSNISVQFIPTDTAEFNTITKSFKVVVSDHKLEDDVIDIITNLSSKNYSVTNEYLYTGFDKDLTFIGNSLKSMKGVEFNLVNNKLLISDTNTNEKMELSILNFSTSYKIDDGILYIIENVDKNDFLKTFETNGVEISIDNLTANYIDDGTVLNVAYKDKILDSYQIKKISSSEYDNLSDTDNVLVNPKTSSPVLIIISILLISSLLGFFAYTYKNKVTID